MPGKSPPPVRERDQSGVYLLELLVAIAVSSMMAAALASNIADTERFSSAGQSQIIATALAQEQIDNARNMTYDDLSLLVGTHTLKVNNPDANYAGCPADGSQCRLNPRPLMLDCVVFQWTDAGTKNRFDGTVTEQIAPGPYPQTLSVTVVASWTEGPALRSYTLKTLVSKNGINNN